MLTAMPKRRRVQLKLISSATSSATRSAPSPFLPEWRASTAVGLAEAMYAARDFDRNAGPGRRAGRSRVRQRRTSWPTAAGRGRTSAGAGLSIWSSASPDGMRVEL